MRLFERKWEYILANTAQATKRARQAVARNLRNRSLRHAARTLVKKTLSSVKAGQTEQAQNDLRQACSALDKLVNKHILTANAVARYKSRLNKKVKALATAA